MLLQYRCEVLIIVHLLRSTDLHFNPICAQIVYTCVCAHPNTTVYKAAQFLTLYFTAKESHTHTHAHTHTGVNGPPGGQETSCHGLFGGEEVADGEGPVTQETSGAASRIPQ